MTQSEPELYLNPITLESQLFLTALEKYSTEQAYVDIELLNVMEKVADAVNKFYDQRLTKIEETNELKLVKAKHLVKITRLYNCTVCKKQLGSAEKAIWHVKDRHKLEILDESRSNNHETTKTVREPQNVKKAVKSVPEVKLPKKARSLLVEKVGKFFGEPLKTANKLKQQPAYDIIEDDLVSAVKSIFPEKPVKMYKFGSRMSGIGNEKSDLDICLDIDNTFHNFESRTSKKTLNTLSDVHSVLIDDPKWENVFAIKSARIPIIRCVHIKTGISCDIGLSNSLGPCNTLLMEYFFELQPIAPRMCIYIKKWLQRTKLDEMMNTYSLTLLVVFFLQVIKRLPSVKELQDGLNGEEVMIGPWISNFKRRTLEECSLISKLEPTKKNFRRCMRDFFDFVATFRFDFLVISPYNGFPIEISKIDQFSSERYLDFLRSHPANNLVVDKPCIVQDPLELCHNVTKNVSQTVLRLFISFAKDSGRLLNEIDQTDDNDDLL